MRKGSPASMESFTLHLYFAATDYPGMAQAPNPVDAANIHLDALVQKVDGAAAVAAVINEEPQNHLV